MNHYSVKPTGVKLPGFGWGLTDPEQYETCLCMNHGLSVILKEGVTVEDVLNETITLEEIDCDRTSEESRPVFSELDAPE